MDINELPPYKLVRAPNGLSMYQYLHIDGHAGHGRKGSGGRYKFTVYYMDEEDHEEMGMVASEVFCQEKKIPFGHGDTIQEAADMLHKTLNPTK